MDQQQAKQKFQEAERLRSSKRFEEALVVYDDLDNAFPNNKDILFGRGIALAGIGRLDEAKAITQKLEAVFSDARAVEIKAAIFDAGGKPEMTGLGSFQAASRGRSRIIAIAAGVLILLVTAVVLVLRMAGGAGPEFKHVSLTSLGGTKITLVAGVLWPPGEAAGAESIDPIAPFRGQSVSFRGFLDGGCDETLEDVHLMYRYRVDVPQPVLVEEISISGRGAQGNNASQIRLLDSNMSVLASVPTTRHDFTATTKFTVNRLIKDAFFLDQFDSCAHWHNVEAIEITVSNPPR